MTALALAMALAVLWWLGAAADPPPAIDTMAGNGALAPADTAQGALATNGAAVAGHGAEAPLREAAAAAIAAPGLGEWDVHLVGIDPDVPWTAPLLLVFENRYRVAGMVDALGTCRVMPPANARLSGIHNLRFITDEENYLLERANQLAHELQQTGTMQLNVYPIARLQGRVLGPDGKGIVARVRAFSFGLDGPQQPLVGRTDSAADGSYTLRVPPATPLLLVADATNAPAAVPWGPPLFEQFGATPSLHELDQPDQRGRRADLLPASLRAEGVHATLRTVPDLRLDWTAQLAGRATFADGSPMAHVDVTAQPVGDSTPAWVDDLRWSPTGLVGGAAARTDAQGAFVLGCASGRSYRVQAMAEDLLLLAGEATAVAAAPGRVELVAPGDLVTVQVEAGGQPVHHAWLDLGDQSRPTNRAGRQRITLGPHSVRVRARADVRTSSVVELPAGARPARVTLELITNELAEVRLHLRGDDTLLAAAFEWLPAIGGPAPVVDGRRPRAEAPFALRVPPGRYQLTVRYRQGEQGGGYVLPLRLEVEVPTSGLSATHDLILGGRLGIDVRDAYGRRPAGTFSLRDATGREVTPDLGGDREWGEPRLSAPAVLLPYQATLLATALPPGDYALVVAPVGRSRIERTVTITRGATNWVTLRLP